jgi:hypothetical protein
MTRARIFRWLRIAWTAFCGSACLTLIVLWVRSYSWNDRLTRDEANTPAIFLESDLGDLHFHRSRPSTAGLDGWRHWKYEQDPSTAKAVRGRPWVRGRFAWRVMARNRQDVEITAPHWSVVWAFGLLAVLPQVRRVALRFSLRTLMIATTLIAATFGLITWAVR